MKLLKVKAALKKTFISLFCLAPQVKTREVKVRNRRKIKQRVKSFPLRARDQGWLIRRLTDRSHSLGSLKILKNKVPQAPKVFFFLMLFSIFADGGIQGEEKRVRVSRWDEGNRRGTRNSSTSHGRRSDAPGCRWCEPPWSCSRSGAARGTFHSGWGW